MEPTEPRALFHLFDWVLREFDLYSREHSLLVIHGPRAYGKGECVQLISRLRPELFPHGGEVINGRDAGEAIARIHQLLDAPGEVAGRWAVLENLDMLVGQSPAEPADPALLDSVVMETITELLGAVKDATHAKFRLIVTLTREPTEIFDKDHTISAILIPASKINLAEHDAEWEEGLRRSLEEFEVDLPGDPDELAAWLRAQADGHPALLLTAVEVIEKVLKEDAHTSFADLRGSIRAGMLLDGTAPVRRQLRRWRSSPLPGAQRALEVLRDTLAADPDQPLDVPTSVLELLREAGILRHLPGRVRRYRVAQGVVREVLFDELGIAPRPRMAIRIDRERERIEVRVTSGSMSGRKELIGNSFLLGLLIFTAGDEVVSPLDHKLRNSRTGEELSDKGMATALNRFLKEVNGIVDDFTVVANVRGQGYRLVRGDRDVVLDYA